jgi:thioredoxin-related protein
VYPAPAVTALIKENFRTVRIHVKDNPTMWHRYHIRWTPTVLILAPDGSEVRRIEGFLPEDEFLGQLRLGLGYMAVNKKDWESAARWFTEAESKSANTDAGPEGMYWAGVARYSGSHDAAHLKDLRRKFDQHYQNTSWAKRSSVWAA